MVVTEDGKPVISYKVTERMPPDNMSVAFLLPRRCRHVPAIVERHRPGMPLLEAPSDSWGCVSYLPGAVPRAGSPESEGIEFLIAAEAISTSSVRRPSAAECTDIWRSLWNAVSPDTRSGRRHVIVFSGSPVTGKGSRTW